MTCRACGACCTAISISSPLPGMPAGKPAGVTCPSLSEKGLCKLFGEASRPVVCSSYPAMPDMCGASYSEALILIGRMEAATAP